jgi:ubiquinol-cytochrome c reductase cytochrome c subunit
MTAPALPARRRRAFAVAAVIALAGWPAALQQPVSPSPTPSVTSAAPAPSPSASSAAPVTGRGAELYGQQCASCHGMQGEGTQRGPSLIGVGRASTDFQLSTGRMPLKHDTYEPLHSDPAFGPAGIDALVDYVASFGPGGPAIPTVRPGDPSAGQQLYAYHCAACHSASGMGATLTNGQVGPSLMRATPTQVGEAIRVGPGLMPAFPDSALSDRDVDAIAGYVQVLQDKRGNLDRGGLALGRLGPFTEGVVAWVLGLGLLVLAIRRLGSRTPR